MSWPVCPCLIPTHSVRTSAQPSWGLRPGGGEAGPRAEGKTPSSCRHSAPRTVHTSVLRWGEALPAFLGDRPLWGHLEAGAAPWAPPAPGSHLPSHHLCFPSAESPPPNSPPRGRSRSGTAETALNRSRVGHGPPPGRQHLLQGPPQTQGASIPAGVPLPTRGLMATLLLAGGTQARQTVPTRKASPRTDRMQTLPWP